VFLHLSYKWQQGKVYALIGPPQQGKATLLKLIGQVEMPCNSKGFVFIPPHLQILHMGREPSYLAGSLLANILCNMTLAEVGGIERVQAICKDCGFSEQLLKHLNVQESPSRNNTKTERQFDAANMVLGNKLMHSLSNTQCARLNLVRALTINTELIVMHMPLVHFTDAEANVEIQLFRKHCAERGLHMPVEDRKFRRPRTVFFTHSGNSDQADEVFEVTQTHGITRTNRNAAGEFSKPICISVEGF